MILTRKQIKQLRSIMKLNKEVKEVTIVESHDSGIGTSMHVVYVATDPIEQISIDITNYESW